MSSDNNIIVRNSQDVELTKSGTYVVEIVEPGAEATIVGLFHATHHTEVVINLTIIHRAPHTRAMTILKGVAEDSSSIRFFGRIVIEEACGDTQSFLEERILLLSPTAKAEAIPELEIQTDEVKCSHAASVSAIPEEQLFYLQSRGISRRVATDMIVSGFLSS